MKEMVLVNIYSRWGQRTPDQHLRRRQEVKFDFPVLLMTADKSPKKFMPPGEREALLSSTGRRDQSLSLAKSA